MTGASAPVSRREMVGLIEDDIRVLESLKEMSDRNIISIQEVERRLRIYTAISLKLRMEENPNAQD